MLRLIAKWTLLLLGISQLTNSENPWSDPEILRGQLAQYWEGISHSRNTLSQFTTAFQTKLKSQSRFMVCGLEKHGNRLIPVGVLVDRIDGDTFYGTRIENDSKSQPSQQSAQIEARYVVDWSFVELWELQGGRFWKDAYGRLSQDRQVAVMQYIYPICQLKPHSEQTELQRKLLKAIIESEYEQFAVFWEELGCPETIPMTRYDVESDWTGHGTGHIASLVLEFSTTGFIGQSCSRTLQLPEDSMLLVASINRPDVFDLVFRLGASPFFEDFMQTTPLHQAARYGDEYAAKRLIDIKVNINAQDNGGRTPLHEAANAKIFSLLLDAGADVYIKTNSPVEPQDPIEMHIQEGHIDILEECERRGLVSPGFVSKMRGESSLLEKGSAAIAEFEDSIGSETYDISSSFRAGPVLPFDFIDAKSGRIGFR
ncbi:MAG: ankyrin repeat domain-containing protein [Pirellula sp.]|jgi:hypothetical protein